MTKTSQMLELERRHDGRSIERIVADALRAHNSVPAAAEALGVTRQTLWNWMFRLGIKVKTVLELPAEVA